MNTNRNIYADFLASADRGLLGYTQVVSKQRPGCCLHIQSRSPQNHHQLASPFLERGHSHPLAPEPSSLPSSHMPRFSVAFGRRKSSNADSLEHAAATGPSFRVLERSEVVGVKTFDGSARLSTTTHVLHKPTGSDVTIDDNIFADIKSNR